MNVKRTFDGVNLQMTRTEAGDLRAALTYAVHLLLEIAHDDEWPYYYTLESVLGKLMESEQASPAS